MAGSGIESEFPIKSKATAARVGRILLWLLLLGLGRGHCARALIIGMPGRDWITQYSIGLCAAKYKSGNYLSWEDLQRQPDHSLTVDRDEVICVAGHGEPGFIGGIAGATIARTLAAKTGGHLKHDNLILLMACSSALAPVGGFSVMQAFADLPSEWSELPIDAAEGICVANPEAEGPLFQTVLINPLPENGTGSFADLSLRQTCLASDIEENLAHARGLYHDDLTLGRHLFDLNDPDGAAVNEKFFRPFLNYIISHHLNQPSGIARKN